MQSQNYDDPTTKAQARRKLRSWLGFGVFVTVICFWGLCLIRHEQETHLLATGFAPWTDTEFYIRVQPQHTLTLIRRYTHADDVDLAFPAILAGMAAMMCLLLWLARHTFKQKPRAAIPVLLITAYLASMSAIFVIRAIYRPEELYISLDTNIISTTEAGTIPLSQITGFGCAVLPAGKNSTAWFVGAEAVNGTGLRLILIPDILPYPQYSAVPQYIAKTVSDFVTSHGKQFPTG